MCSLGNVSRREKKLLAVDGEIAQKIIEIANRKGMTVYNFTNYILQQAIKAENLNRSLDDIVERFRLLEIVQDSGAIFATTDILSYMVKRLYQQEKEKLCVKWYKSGLWYGKYLQVKFGNGEPLEMLKKLLDACAPKSSEVRIVKEGDKLSLHRVSPTDSLEYTELFSKFLEGVIHSFGYETKKNDVSKGLIALEFERKNLDEMDKRNIEKQ